MLCCIRMVCTGAHVMAGRAYRMSGRVPEAPIVARVGIRQPLRHIQVRGVYRVGIRGRRIGTAVTAQARP